MSVAVAVRKGSTIVVAADTQENFGDEKVPRANHGSSKILRIGRTYVAMTGWGVYDNILRDYVTRGRPRLGSEREIFTFFMTFWRQLRRRYSLVNDQAHEDDPSPFADLDSSFLVAGRAGIFYVSGNMSVIQLREYYAIGSGAPYALGALHVLSRQSLALETVARRACEAGTAFDVYSGGEIEVFRV
jgi:ATP-dependent protease HslVU (ClpYQ) peptidase subunit